MQVEGGIENNDWAEAERRGKTPPIGKACDFYNRYESDLDIAKSLNLNTFRFSVEWARIEPEEGKFDEKELEHYRALVKAVRERGMEPFVTIWHFSLPMWFVDAGSFGRKNAPQIFARYAAKVTEAFGSDVRFYITMNEPMVWLGEHGRIMGASPGFWPNPFMGLRYLSQLEKSHREAYRAMKQVNKDAQIGIAKHNLAFVGTNIFGKSVAVLSRYFWNRAFFSVASAPQDFIGLQFYQRIYYWQSAKERREVRRSDIGWQMHPGAVYEILMEAAQDKLPIYITETGVADAKDQYRSWFIYETLKSVHRACEDGACIKGYLHWSLLDNYEFTFGFRMRFGLVEVNHETQERKVRESAKKYAEVAKSGILPNEAF